MSTFINITSTGSVERPQIGVEILLDVPKSEEERLDRILTAKQDWQYNIDKYFPKGCTIEYECAKLILRSSD